MFKLQSSRVYLYNVLKKTGRNSCWWKCSLGSDRSKTFLSHETQKIWDLKVFEKDVQQLTVVWTSQRECLHFLTCFPFPVLFFENLKKSCEVHPQILDAEHGQQKWYETYVNIPIYIITSIWHLCKTHHHYLPHPPPTFFALITVIKFERKIRQYRDSKQKRTEFHCCHDNSVVLTIANKILTIAHKCQ